MKRQYEVYSCMNAGTEIYVNNPDELKESVERTKILEQDILLDIVWAEDEEVAIQTIAEIEDIHPDTLYAIQHVADAMPSSRMVSDSWASGRFSVPAGGYMDEDDFGFEVSMPDGRTIRLKFNHEMALELILENLDTGDRTTLYQSDSLVSMESDHADSVPSEEASEWILTDQESFQICRKMLEISERNGDSAFELYQLQAVPGNDEDRFCIAHDIVHLKDVDILSVIDCYGYEDLDAVKEEYGGEWERIIAEWSFELDSGCLENLISSTMTWDEGFRSIRCMAGI